MHRHACCNTLLFVCAQLSIDYVLHHVFCLLLNTGSYKPSQASKVVRPVYICLASCCTCMQTSFLVCFAHIWPAQDDPPSPAQFPTCNRYQVCVPYVGIYVSISHYKMKRVVQNLYLVGACGRISRSSKRLRGEMVNKLAVYDDPELLRRRIRQATQGESGHKAAARPPRAVHFQQPPSDHNGPDAMEEEAQLMQGAEAEQEEQFLAETPDVGLTAAAAAADSAGSGLKLMLLTSAARPEDSGMMDEDGIESQQMQALHTASSLAPEPPDTTGKVLATSKDSLRKALDIAQGILRSDSEGAAAAAGPADVGDIIPARPVITGAKTAAGGAKLSQGASPTKSAAVGAKSSKAASPAKSAAAGAKSSQAAPAELAHLPDSVNASDASVSQQSGGKAHLEESPAGLQSARREVGPGNSVLASTTRPNMPRKVGGNLAQLKAASSPAVRVTHAGHTPHPSKSRMFPADQPAEGTPHGSTGQTGGPREGDRDQEGATPAVTLKPFGMSLGPAPFSTTAGNSTYPDSNGSPIEDTPMAVFSHAVPSRMVPDSCVGQVCNFVQT